MKNKFILALATVGIILLSTMTAFGAEWKLNGENWQYIDNSGNVVTNEFKKSGENLYFLGDDGNMVKSSVVDYNDNYYYVDENGAMTPSAWIFTKINDDDEDAHWMYFGTTGKAYKSGWKEIADKKYHFTDGKMDYGFLDANGVMIDEDTEDPYKTATYYCGTEDDGAMIKNAWLKVDSSEPDKGYVWLYFNNAGKKLSNCVKEINGKKYGFDTEGAMVMEWAQATAATASGSNYYNEESGLLKKTWYYGLKGDDSEEGWYYFNGQGNCYAGVVKKIDGAYYAFDAKGKMMTGFVEVTSDMKVVSIVSAPAENVKKSDVETYIGDYMYFTETDGPTLGAAVKGKQTIEISDGKIKVNFSNSKGIAEANGFKNVNGYAYYNSVLQTADEDHKYQKVTLGGTDYLVTQAGKICKKGTYKDSLNNLKWEVAADGTITGPTAY